jgi:uroporphyrinogen-III synthase
MKSLKNRVIISTRPLSDNDIISDYLSEKGATVLEFPMIEICPAEINDKIRNAINNLNSFQWIIFTSKNGVTQFFKIISQFSFLSSQFLFKIAVIGEKTAREVIKYGVTPHYISSGNTSEEMLNELINNHIKPKDNVLLILGKLAKDTLEKGLSQIAEVTRIDVYQTLPAKVYSKYILEKIIKDNYDLLIFTSPSGFNNFMTIINENKCFNKFRIACIGKTTEKEILKHKQNPLKVASKSEGLSFAKEIEKYFSKI